MKNTALSQHVLSDIRQATIRSDEDDQLEQIRSSVSNNNIPFPRRDLCMYMEGDECPEEPPPHMPSSVI